MPNETVLLIIKIAKFCALFGSAVIFFLFLRKLAKRTGNVSDLAKREIDDAFKKHGIMDNYKKRMSKLGIMYRAKDYNLNPSWYIMVRIAIGMIAALLIYLLFENPTYAFVGILLGYFGTDVFYKLQNSSDNKEMMLDLYNTYANLRIQLKSGYYIVESLEYTQKNAQNNRYREALGELIINFADKTIPVSTAVSIFRDRFQSKEVDKLCSLILNCMTYGIQEEYAKDIMEESRGIILADTIEAERRMDNKTSIICMLLFGIIILITAYSFLVNFNGISLS